jgi:hypothetical protein
MIKHIRTRLTMHEEASIGLADGYFYQFIS